MFPPGPPGLPLLGHFKTMMRPDLLKSFMEIHAKFGAVFSVNLGPRKRAVVIGSVDALKEAADKIVGRSPNMNWMNVDYRNGNGKDARGITYSTGKEWEEQRQFLHMRLSLKELVLGDTSLEQVIMNEAFELRSDLEKREGEDVEIGGEFTLTAVNVVWRLLAGKRFELDDKALNELVSNVRKKVSRFNYKGDYFLYPWLRHVAPGPLGFNVVKVAETGMKSLVEKAVSKHLSDRARTTRKSDIVTKDLIDAFINKTTDASETKMESSLQGELGMQSMNAVCLDMLSATIEKMSLTLAWTFLAMAKYTEAQKSVREELDAVLVGRRAVTLNDKVRLHRLRATILEVQRFACINAITMERRCPEDEDVKVGSFVIPRGTDVYFNYYAAQRDAFERPDDFDPSRFLVKGKFRSDSRADLIYGLGRRDCPGKAIAADFLFLAIGTLLQHFEVSPAADSLSMEAAEFGLLREPRPFKVSYQRR